jgi:hypothetical protein
MIHKKTLGTLLLLAAGLSSLPAASVFNDTFTYPDGGIVASSGGIWANNSGTAGSMLVTNGALIVSSSRSEDIAGTFGTTFMTNGPTVALYSSFTLKCVVRPSLGGTYFAHFTGSNGFNSLSGFRARIWATTTNVAAVSASGPTEFMLGVANTGSNGSPSSGQWATPLETNVTYTVVTRYELATGISTLWINPTAEGDPSVTATDDIPSDPAANGLPTQGPVNISHYGFRQATGEGTLIIDNLKIGTAFNDVAGANTAPSISPIASQNTPANTAIGPIDVTVSDTETAASSLILTSGSSNTGLVPTNNIVFGGSGTDRTVTITPVNGQEGSTLITLYVTDGVNTSSTTFLLTVGAPTISDIPNISIYSNTPSAEVAFTVGDAETAAGSLIVSNEVSNPSLISSVVLGGGGANRTVQVIPAADQTGVSTVTVYVSDGTHVTSTSFLVNVSAKLGLLLSDTFSYTEFLQDTALLGATGSPWGHASGTNYDLLVIEETAQLTSVRSEDVGAALSSGSISETSGTLLFAGFHMTLTNLPSQNGNYFAHFKDTISGTSFRAKIYASTTNAATGKFRVGIANLANNVDAQVPQDLELNQTNSVIVRYNTATGESTLWLNPSSEASASVSADDTAAALAIGAFGLRQDSGIGTIRVDDLLVGTSMADMAPLLVTNVNLSPIPLTIQLQGSSAVLSWANSAFSLQSSTNVGSGYATITGASSPFTNVLNGSQVFFRLVHTNGL